MRNEATWTGHVGVGAKAETFDVAFRGEVSIKSGVEIASTGKVLKRNPTRTYRSALTKKGVPVKFDPIALAKELTFRGPKGERGDAEGPRGRDRAAHDLDVRVDGHPVRAREGRQALVRRSAPAPTLDFSSTPEKVVKGGRGDWNAWVIAQDGTRAADARWTLTSSCGALSAATLSGATVQFGVADAAGAWEPGTAGACVSGEITSTAGRPRALAPLDPAAGAHPLPLRHRHRLQEGHGLGDRPDPRDGARTGDGRPG